MPNKEQPLADLAEQLREPSSVTRPATPWAVLSWAVFSAQRPATQSATPRISNKEHPATNSGIQPIFITTGGCFTFPFFLCPLGSPWLGQKLFGFITDPKEENRNLAKTPQMK
jgi:hypothetical protein